jgi:LmbE family N-acetylglucosaminyl deacetylase
MEVAPYSNKNSSFNPNIFVDISEQMQLKIIALKCYRKYFDEELQHNVTGLAAFRGQACSAKYAEAFDLQFRVC